MIKKLNTILSIIPNRFKKKSIRFLSLTLINILLDLISIAYLIPIFILILDSSKAPKFLTNYFSLTTNFNISILILFTISFILKNITQIKINNFQSKLIFDIASEISSQFLKSFFNKNFIEFQKKNTAKSIQNIKIVGSDFSNHILLSINTFLTEGIIILTMFVISLYFYFKITLIIMLVLGLIFILLLFFRKKKIATINNSLKDSYATVTSYLLNIIQGFIELKSLRREEYYQQKFNNSIQEFNGHYNKVSQYRQSNNKYLEILVLISLVLFLFFIKNDKNGFGYDIVLISFIASFSIKLMPSINKVIIAHTNFQSFKYTINILKDVNKYSYPIKNSIIFKFSNEILLNNITFYYQQDKPILTNVNLKITKGQIIGIYGTSGAGKTTLLNIIMNLISPLKGKIVIDNIILTENENLFHFINYLPQNPFLFEGTILENIVMGQNKNDINLTRIQELASILKINDLLTLEINKNLDSNSLELSGGQKQRIALLRALYHDFELLILDEGTNQLDFELENEIFNYLISLKKELKTIIFVSHNMKVKNISDQYYLLKNNTLIKAN